MFTVGTKSGQDIVPLGETAEILALMLKFLYPFPTPTVSSFEQLEKALHVADKYQLKGMTTRLREQLSLPNSPVSISADPLCALVVSCAHGFQEEADAATSLATKQHIVHRVHGLIGLAKLAPSTIPFIRLLGVPLMRIQILSDVLLKFYKKPMQLDANTCKWPACSYCFDTYYATGFHSAPEWQARWANAVFTELKCRPVHEWDPFFKVEFFHTAVIRRTHVPIMFSGNKSSCACVNYIMAYPDSFEQWSMTVLEYLKTRFQGLDELERMKMS